MSDDTPRLRRWSHRFRASWRARVDRQIVKEELARAAERKRMVQADDPYMTSCSDAFFDRLAEEEEAGR